MSNHDTWAVWYINRHAIASAPNQKTAHRMANLRQLIAALMSVLGLENVDPGLGERKDDPGGGGGGAYTPANEHIPLGNFRAASVGLPETDGDWEAVCESLEREVRRLIGMVSDHLGDDDD